MPLLNNDNDPNEDQGFKVAKDLQNREVGFEARLNRIYGRKSDNQGTDEPANGDEDFITNDNSDKANENRNKTKSQEEAGDDTNNTPPKGTKFGGFLKSKKRLLPGGVIALLIALVGGGSVAIIPSSLIVMFERVMTNNGTHDARANSTMGRARIGAVFSPMRDAICKTRATCMPVTMSTKDIARWNSQNGVRIEEGRTAFGRKIITAMSVDIPGGQTVRITNSTEFNAALRDHQHFRDLNMKAQNHRANYFIGPDSKFRSVLKKYKLSMANLFSKVTPGTSKEENTQKFNDEADKATGAETSSESRLAKVKQKVTSTHEKFRSGMGVKAARAIGTPAGWGDTACTLYTVHKATLTTIKLSYYSELIKYFMPVAVLAGQTMEGDADPELVEYVGDRFTWYQPEATADTPEKKAKVNLTATDSQGFQAALYGDFGKLQEFTKEYVPWWAISAATMSGMLKEFEESVGGKENIHKACVTAKYGSYLSSFSPTSLGLMAGCAVANVLADDACTDAVMAAFQAVVDQGLETVYERMEETRVDSSLKGVDFGNALAAGIGLFLMEKGRGSGLKPATSVAAVGAYLASTEEAYQQDVLAQKEQAMMNPFDTTNTYSFMSNVITSLTPQKTEQTTGYSVMANYLGVLTNTLKPSVDTTHAGIFQPIEGVNQPQSLQSMTKDGNVDGSGRTCEDEDMNEAGFLCDMYGRSVDVLDPEPMKWAGKMKDGDMNPWSETVDYMQNGGYLEQDGSGKPVGYEQYNENPNPDDPAEEKVYDNEYLMWKAYCTNDRVYPLGTTMMGYSEDGSNIENMGWFMGTKCGGNNAEGNPVGGEFNTKLNRFFFYYNMCEVQLGYQKCWENEPAGDTKALGSVTPNTGDWVTPTSGPCVSKYGMRTLNGRTAQHAGIDISPPARTPIVAPTSMKITLAKYTSDGYGVMVTATATDGSEYSFRFGHMGPNNSYIPPVQVGQEVSKGDVIGEVGSTGNSTAPHLHFEVFPPGKDPASFSGAVDPVPVLAENGVSLTCGG